MNGESKDDGRVFRSSDALIEKGRALRARILDRIAKDEAFRDGLLDNPAKAMLESGLFDEIQAHRKATLEEIADKGGGMDPAYWIMCSARTCAAGSSCSDSV